MNESVKMSGKRVAVGLSGGVDSAVTAALLQRAGAEVIGIFAKGWYPPGMPCTWAEDRRDAMRVAARLKIPFHTLDASAAYKEEVIDYLLAEYAAGRTPNPDVFCNRAVKFGVMAEFAKKLGADYLATGHYAQRSLENGVPMLLRGADSAKDQSYFLWAVSASTLGRVLFPLGAMRKDATREVARAFGLPVAAKKDSQGICFLGSISVENFLRQEFHPEPGAALDRQGNTIGTHDGAVLHTIGARVALQDAAPGPWYVVAKDMRSNTLTVAHGLAPAAGAPEIALTQTNWLADAIPVSLHAQYRYHGPRIAGTLTADRTRFVPSQPLAEPLSSGQSLVLYDGERVIGGGIIAT